MLLRDGSLGKLQSFSFCSAIQPWSSLFSPQMCCMQTTSSQLKEARSFPGSSAKTCVANTGRFSSWCRELPPHKCHISMSYLLPHLHTGYSVDQAILSVSYVLTVNTHTLLTWLSCSWAQTIMIVSCSPAASTALKVRPLKMCISIWKMLACAGGR